MMMVYTSKAGWDLPLSSFAHFRRNRQITALDGNADQAKTHAAPAAAHADRREVILAQAELVADAQRRRIAGAERHLGFDEHAVGGEIGQLPRRHAARGRFEK